ncbi:MAG: hypothetical protein H0X01_01195 [Nitrospira sp.]|nr:hypothetical protein [Nitrospira sp.]
MAEDTNAVRQVVDPSVSRRKFQREVDELRTHEAVYRERGWYLAEATYPRLMVVMGAPQTRPPLIAFGVLFDFTNYDLWPPEVTLVDPFTAAPYKAGELPTHLLRKRAAATPGQPDPPPLRMMIWGDAGSIPFICLPGIRAYHAHPSHTGDSWLLHRTTGAGRLHHILDILHRYGSQKIVLGIHVVMQQLPP